jgi:hypothetical protein
MAVTLSISSTMSCLAEYAAVVLGCARLASSLKQLPILLHIRTFKNEINKHTDSIHFSDQKETQNLKRGYSRSVSQCI